MDLQISHKIIKQQLRIPKHRKSFAKEKRERTKKNKDISFQTKFLNNESCRWSWLLSFIGLKQFIISQGSSRTVVQMEWDKIWSFNKKIIDPVAPRYTALEKSATARVLIRGVQEKKTTAALHPKNEAVGNKDVWISDKVLIDSADVDSLRVGENATFINWGNIKISNIKRYVSAVYCSLFYHLIDFLKYFSNTKEKMTKLSLKPSLILRIRITKKPRNWRGSLSPTKPSSLLALAFTSITSSPNPFWLKMKTLNNTSTRTPRYEHILYSFQDSLPLSWFVFFFIQLEIPMLGDPELVKLKKGDIIQLQRRGYFICDSPYVPAT